MYHVDAQKGEAYLGEAWGKGTPVVMDSYEHCLACDYRSQVRIVAYEDKQYYYCYHCRHTVVMNGRKQLEILDPPRELENGSRDASYSPQKQAWERPRRVKGGRFNFHVGDDRGR